MTRLVSEFCFCQTWLVLVMHETECPKCIMNYESESVALERLAGRIQIFMRKEEGEKACVEKVALTAE